jgi:hypothetical protein
MIPGSGLSLTLALLWVASFAGAASAQRQLPQLRVGQRPSLTIGKEGDPLYEFTRVAHTIELPSRQLVVVDAQSSELRVFGSDGRFVRSLGRGGSGPGEFRRISSVFSAGDSIIVWDSTLRRLTTYLASGELVSTTPVTLTSEKRFDIVGRLKNGTWLLATPTLPTLDRPAGLYRDSVGVGVMSTEIKWIGVFPGPMLWVYKPNPNAAHGLAVGIAAFSPWTRTLAAGDRILVADPLTSTIHVLTDTGRRAGLIRVPLSAQRVTATHIRRSLETELGRARTVRDTAVMRAKFERALVPTHAPLYSDVTLSSTGELWLQAFPIEERSPTRFVGVRLTGDTVGEFSLQSGSRLLHVGADYLWHVVANDDGVEVLQRRSLVR